jgi:hypothetical protein
MVMMSPPNCLAARIALTFMAASWRMNDFQECHAQP